MGSEATEALKGCPKGGGVRFEAGVYLSALARLPCGLAVNPSSCLVRLSSLPAPCRWKACHGVMESLPRVAPISAIARRNISHTPMGISPFDRDRYCAGHRERLPSTMAGSVTWIDSTKVVIEETAAVGNGGFSWLLVGFITFHELKPRHGSPRYVTISATSRGV